MSACISSHGEFGRHECSVDFVCDYCGVLDEDAIFAALNEAKATIARAELLLVIGPLIPADALRAALRGPEPRA